MGVVARGRRHKKSAKCVGSDGWDLARWRLGGWSFDLWARVALGGQYAWLTVGAANYED